MNNGEEEPVPASKKGGKKAAAKKEKGVETDAEEDAPAPVPKKGGKKGAAKKEEAVDTNGHADHTEDETPEPSPKPKKAVTKKGTATKKEPAKGSRTSSRAKSNISYTEPKENEGFLLSASDRKAAKEKTKAVPQQKK